MRKNNCGLLPFDRTDLYGLSPNDSQFCGWEIEKFNIKKQWKFATGKNITVAVIDTGCDLFHDDLKNNLIQGINILNPNKDPMDDNGHGSHVSSTIAASNNGVGMVGVAPDAKIMPVKALNGSGQGSLQDIVKGIIWAVDNKADIITMSLGSPQTNSSLEQALDYAAKNDVIVFCAAGNSGPDTDIMYPAKSENTVAIGAIDKYLSRTVFSCSGDTLDFLAPGQEILGCVPGNRYAIMSGTSMSNPFAAGCAALLKEYCIKRNIKLSSYNDYINIFKKQVIHLEDPAYTNQKRYEGYGILNINLSLI